MYVNEVLLWREYELHIWNPNKTYSSLTVTELQQSVEKAEQINRDRVKPVGTDEKALSADWIEQWLDNELRDNVKKEKSIQNCYRESH